MDMYYKIIYNNIIIDVVKNPSYVRYMHKTNRFIITDISSADGIIGNNENDNNEIYLFNHIDGLNYKTISMINISESEYLNLKSQIKENTFDSNNNILDIQNLKNELIEQMRIKCRDVIVKGFDVVLSDGVLYHFSLEITDQLDIQRLKSKADNGATKLAWHSDNQLTRYFSSQDVNMISDKMNYCIEYNTIYFNSLRNYILNIDDRIKLMNIYYGIEIPEQFQSDVYKELNVNV